MIGCCSERVVSGCTGCTESPESRRSHAEENPFLGNPTVPYEERVVQELGQGVWQQVGISKN